MTNQAVVLQIFTLFFTVLISMGRIKVMVMVRMLKLDRIREHQQQRRRYGKCSYNDFAFKHLFRFQNTDF